MRNRLLRWPRRNFSLFLLSKQASKAKQEIYKNVAVKVLSLVFTWRLLLLSCYFLYYPIRIFLDRCFSAYSDQLFFVLRCSIINKHSTHFSLRQILLSLGDIYIFQMSTLIKTSPVMLIPFTNYIYANHYKQTFFYLCPDQMGLLGF